MTLDTESKTSIVSFPTSLGLSSDIILNLLSVMPIEFTSNGQELHA